MKKLRILLADDHGVVRKGLRFLLETEPDLEVVGEASDGRQAVDLTGELRPDVVVMDIAMPVMDGIEAARAIRDELPATRVVMVTGSAATDDVSRARSAGASGYVTKDQIAGDLIRAILDAAAA